MEHITGMKTKSPKREEDKKVLELGELLVKKLTKEHSKLNVYTHTGIFYNIMIDSKGKYLPVKNSQPTWANSAFSSDIIIGYPKEESDVDIVPLVRIEVKLKPVPKKNAEGIDTKPSGFNTDNILLYSSKSALHKHVYPYMRYGFLFLRWGKIDDSFYLHYDNVDFAYAQLDIVKWDKLDGFVELLKRQIQSAKNLINLYKLDGTLTTKSFESNIRYE